MAKAPKPTARVCVVCGRKVLNAEPGIDYCSPKCFEKERTESS